MIVLGIETSCDECSVAVVRDGKEVLSNVVVSQIEIHKPYYGVVPEIASRTHTRWIIPVYKKALADAGLALQDIDGIAVTTRPGLIGSLLVGLSFAKGLALTTSLPLIGVNHIKAHLYAPHLEYEITYPYIGLLVSGGHTIICKMGSFDDLEIIGTTIDDACGEAFDKVAKYYAFGYPGGLAIDKLSTQGDPAAYAFPTPSLHKGDHEYDVSYSGLKTAVINQSEQFRKKGKAAAPENIAASFQKKAIDILLAPLRKAMQNFGLTKIVVGGGVAANSYLRRELSTWQEAEVIFPSLALCTDNAAMIAGVGYNYLFRGDRDDLSLKAYARVPAFRRLYP